MKAIKKLPDLRWSARAARQIESAGGDALVQCSHVAYRLGNAAVIGLVYQNLFSPPWLWFALAEDVSMRDLIDFRKLQDQIPRGTLTSVQDGDTTAIRFAAFYGFEDSGQIVEHEGLVYILMRKV